MGLGEEVDHVLGGDGPGKAEHAGQVGAESDHRALAREVGTLSHSPNPAAFVFYEVVCVEQSKCLQKVTEVNREAVSHQVVSS